LSLPTYIIGQDPKHERYFVFRTESPRFVAELVEPDEADDGLILEDGEGLNIREWIDAPQPSSSVKPYLAEISGEVARHGEMTGLTNLAYEPRPEKPVFPPLDAL
jgi:hypothetical protein